MPNTVLPLGCESACKARSIFVGGVCMAFTLPIADVDGDRLASCRGGEARLAGGIRDCGVIWGDGSMWLWKSRRVRMEGDGVSIVVTLPFRTGVERRDDASAAATVEGRVGSTALETSGHALASHALCCSTSVRLPRCTRAGFADVMCDTKLCRSVGLRRPWLRWRRMETGEDGRFPECWPLRGVEGAALLLLVFSELQPAASSSGGVLAELVMERRVEDRPRTGEGVWLLLVALVGDAGVTAGSLKRIARSRSLAEVLLPPVRLDTA